MKRFIPVLILILVLLLGACATLKPGDKVSLLRAEMVRWQNFSADGVIRVTHSGLTLHKLFVLAKTTESARLDMLDGGAFGISPTPLVSVYVADYLAVESNFLPQLQTMALALPDPSEQMALLADSDALIERYGQQITKSGSLDVNETRLSFTPQMKLEKILDLSSGAEISISYNSKGNPDKVIFSISKNTAIELLVDNISYGGATTVPLPKPDTSSEPENLMDLLKGFNKQP